MMVIHLIKGLSFTVKRESCTMKHKKDDKGGFMNETN